MTNKRNYTTYIVLDRSQNSLDFGAIWLSIVTNTKYYVLSYCHYQIFKTFFGTFQIFSELNYLDFSQ